MTDTGADGKAVVRRYIEAVNAGDTTALDELWTRDLVWHGGVFGQIRGLDAFKEAVAQFLTAFPDLHITIEDIVSEGDRLALRLAATGTHRGEFMGLRATGRSGAWTAHPIYRMEAGRLVEGWFCEDLLGLLQQLGEQGPLPRTERGT